MGWLKKIWVKQKRKEVEHFKKYSQDKCLNCNHPLGKFDRFCSRCGQKNSKKKLNLGDLMREFMATMFAYDSRVQHTFNAIFTSPGKIAKEYVAGKRVKYVNPFRFFIFIAIVFFLLVSWMLPYEKIYQSQETPDIYDEKVKEEPKTSVADSISVDSIQPQKNDLKDSNSLKDQSKNDGLYVYLKKNGYKTFEETRKARNLEDNFYNWIQYKYSLSASLIEK